MNRRLIVLATLAAALLPAAPAAASSAGAAYNVKALWGDTNLPPGGAGQFEIAVQNAGDAVLPGAGFTLSDRLPKGLTVTKITWRARVFEGAFSIDLSPYCSHAETPPASETETVTCHIPGGANGSIYGYPFPLLPMFATPFPGPDGPAFFGGAVNSSGFLPRLYIDVAVPAAASGSAANTATVATPLNVATRTDGGPGANEFQALIVKANAGQLKLLPATAAGTGTASFFSKNLTSVSTSFGQFRVGDQVSGRGIQSGTTITAIESSGTKLVLSNYILESYGPAPVALTAREPTADLAYNAPANEGEGPGSVEAALKALPGIEPGNVAVTGGPGDAAGSRPYLVEFKGKFAAQNVPPMSAADGATPLSGGAPDSTDTAQVPFDPTPSAFGVTPGSFENDAFSAAFPLGSASRQAGAHPFELRTSFQLNHLSIAESGTRQINVNAAARTVEVTLPRGFIGNPQTMPKCNPADFANVAITKARASCPADTQVGFINLKLTGGDAPLNDHAPIFNLIPPKGTPVDLAFTSFGIQAHIYAALDPAQNYAIKSLVPDITSLFGEKLRAAEVTVWGVPADPAHDRFRWFDVAEVPAGSKSWEEVGAPWGTAPIRPFFTNPMDCGAENGGARIRAESYEHPGEFTPVQEYGNPDNVTGCKDQRFRFQPNIAMQPTDRHAGAPTGLAVHLEVPQANDEAKEAKELYAENGNVKGIATPPIKKAVVTFPAGMTLNPSAAQGLVGCTPAQIGLGTNSPVSCPDASQYGTLIIHTPLLPVNEQPTGFIYIAKQRENPFSNFLSFYMVIQEPENGILVKIPFKAELDHQTGRITGTLDDLPQFPVSDMQMTLKGGVRAGLVEPSTCGEKTIRAEFFTWQDPATPHPVSDSYQVTEKPDGSPCVGSLAQRPFAPKLSAGTLNPLAGSYSPFVMHLTRTDEDQELSQLGVTLPMGLAAKFAGVGICPDSGIAQALSREKLEGDGALEQSDPSCPASSQIGTTMVGTGTGVPLSWVPGKVYLGGPYKGAPMSLVVISPAVVGPYDLGVITVRTALNVNPVTAQGEATSDPFPQIFQGIPVRIRDVRLNLNRPGFILNPTSCAVKSIEAKLTGTGGTAASLSNRFQASECASLGFKPSLAFRLYGGTKRGAHPRLKATVKMPQGGANIASARVTLPHSEFLDQGHIRTVCTRVQFAAHECPVASIYGYAIARTPLFDHPLEGPVYLRSSNHKLPDLVAALKGPASQPVEVDLDGRIDSVNGGIRNSFELVPDASVTEFTLEMQGNRKGLLVNSTNLCASTNRANAEFTAQNGRRATLHPAMQVACRKKQHKHKR